MIKTCTLVNCNRRLSGRGMCSTHYRYWSKDNRDKIKEFTKKRESHGLEASPEYNTWCDIKKRTYNKNRADYVNYGGRGIKVCDRWLESFVAFYEDMGKRPSSKHSIERRDVNKDYSPENCYWATRTVQAINRRLMPSNKSGVSGVRFSKQANCWIADIRLDYKLIYLGRFVNVEDAIKARKEAEIKYFKPLLE